MKTNMKWIGVLAAVAWVAAPAGAYINNVVVDPSTGELAIVWGQENLKV